MKWPFDPRLLGMAEGFFVLFMLGMAVGYVSVALTLAVGLALSLLGF